LLVLIARRVAVKPFSTHQALRNNSGVASGMDTGEVTFKVVADSGKVIVDGLWANIMPHENGEKYSKFLEWVNGLVVQMAGSEVGVSTIITLSNQLHGQEQ
jgi:hypothetical protein